MSTAVAIAVAALLVLAMAERRAQDLLPDASSSGQFGAYRAYSNYPRPQIQDRDVYFHGLGRSIEEARKADIIILGHSVWLYAIDDVQVREFNAKYRVRLFNMASAGNASGDFIREVIKRWYLHPRLWVINCDDEPVSFFHSGVDDYAATGSSSALEIVKTPDRKGWSQALRRELLWSLTDLIGILPNEMQAWWFPGFANRFQTWRSVETGNWLFPPGSYYDMPTDLVFAPPARQCPLDATELSLARDYLADIGGSPILTDVPYARWCPQRVNDLAAALHLEAILPPTAAYANGDGRHMVRAGAREFTTWFLAALADTSAFRALTASVRDQEKSTRITSSGDRLRQTR